MNVKTFIKLAWGNTYYHGSKSGQEASILSEGLRPNRGSGANDAFGSFVSAAPEGTPLKRSHENFKKNMKGRVAMSKSKNLARIYGIATDPDRRKRMLDIITESAKKDKLKDRLKGIGGALKEYRSYQPLKVSGKGLSTIKDPDQPLSRLFEGSIDSSRISRAEKRNPLKILASKLIRRGK